MSLYWAVYVKALYKLNDTFGLQLVSITHKLHGLILAKAKVSYWQPLGVIAIVHNLGHYHITLGRCMPAKPVCGCHSSLLKLQQAGSVTFMRL